MDPDETYRALAVAMARLQSLLDMDPDMMGEVGRRENAELIRSEAQDATTAWTDLDAWLKRGGFPPKGWA